MARNYLEGTATNDSGAAEVYRNVSVTPVGDKNALVSATVSAAYATRVDEVSSSLTYVGKAVIGTAVATAGWQISRIVISGTETIITYADGNASFDNIWNDRASLSYS